MARARYHHGDLPRALRAAARTLVRRDGAQGFSLRAAAKSAGVDPAAVYRHYRDKQALLDAVAEDGFVELAQAMEDAAARHRKPALKLRAAGEAYLGFAVGAPRLFRLMFDTKRVDPAAVAARTESGKNAYETLLGILEALRSAGEASLSARRAALPVWSAVHGLAELALLDRIDDVDAALADVLAVLLAGLAAD